MRWKLEADYRHNKRSGYVIAGVNERRGKFYGNMDGGLEKCWYYVSGSFAAGFEYFTLHEITLQLFRKEKAGFIWGLNTRFF